MTTKEEWQVRALKAELALVNLNLAIRTMLRYDCCGPEGDYGAGMEPGDGYVDYYELVKLVDSFSQSSPAAPSEGEKK